MKLPALFLVLSYVLTVAACSSADAPTREATASADTMAAQAAQDWMVLFDGTNLDHWKGYGREEVQSGWQIEDGTLAFVPGNEGGDLITKEQFDDFEMTLEWKISERGNSGIFYRGLEGYGAIWETAPEMQVLDNEGPEQHPDSEDPTHRAGAVYDLWAPPDNVVRPAGEWNEVRIVADGPHVEHWLNGVKVAEYEQWSDTWNAEVAASKFKDMPDFGTAREGHIGLQDHGDRVWYRNIKIRRLN